MDEYVGFDVSKEETNFCVMDEAGMILAQGKARSNPEALLEMLREQTLWPERIVLETGTLSNWPTRGLRRRGMPVDIIDARQAHAVMKLQHNKTDANALGLVGPLQSDQWAHAPRSAMCFRAALIQVVLPRFPCLNV